MITGTGRRTTGATTGRPVQEPDHLGKPERTELKDLNKRQPRAMPADVKRPNNDAGPVKQRHQTYAGAKTAGTTARRRRSRYGGASAPMRDRLQKCKVPTRAGRPRTQHGRQQQRLQGSQQGQAKPGSRPAQAPSGNRPSTSKVKPQSSRRDRGHAKRRPSRRKVETADCVETGERAVRRMPAVVQGRRCHRRVSGTGGGGPPTGRKPAREAEHAAGRSQQGRRQRRWRW